MKYTTVFFDWGGVVADDPGDEFLGMILKNVGASGEQIHQIFKTHMHEFMRGKMSEQEYWQAIHDEYGFNIPESIGEEFMKWSGLRANEQILDLIDEVKSHGLRAALFSNVIEPSYNALDRAGCYTRFDALVASCKDGYAKPDREFYELALARLGTTAEQSIFIDDKQRNLDPADELGLTTILAKKPSQIIEDVRVLIN